MSIIQTHKTLHPGRIFSLQHTQETGECRLLLVDDRELTILRRMLAVFPRYYWVWGLAGPMNTWLSSDRVLWDQIQDVIETLEAKLVMTCTVDSLVSALEDVKGAIIATSCCGGGGAIPVNGYTERGTPYVGTVAGLGDGDIDLGEYPTGESDPDYLAGKCHVANLLVEGLINTLNNMSLFSLAAMVQGAVAVGVIAVFAASLLTGPGIAIVAAVMVAAGLSEVVFASLANDVADNREELVCSMMQAETALDAYDFVANAVRNFGSIAGVDLSIVETFVMSILPVDALNSLYTLTGLPELALDDPYDCGDCPDDACFDIIGTGVDLGGNDYQSAIGASGRQGILHLFDSGPDCDRYVTIDNCSVLSAPSGYPVRWVAYENGYEVIYNNVVPPPNNLEMQRLIVDHYPQTGGVSFVVHYEWSEV